MTSKVIDKQLALEYYIEQKLSEMQAEKAERLKTIFPNLVTKSELFEAIEKDKRAALNKLFNEKKIKVHKTIHAPIMDFVEYVGDKENG